MGKHTLKLRERPGIVVHNPNSHLSQGNKQLDGNFGASLGYTMKHDQRKK